MRGVEVLGGYGYAEREEYERPRGELRAASMEGSSDAPEDGEDSSRS
jgi:hypothetical protein